MLYVKQKEKKRAKKEWRWDTALRTLKSVHVKPLRHMEAEVSPTRSLALCWIELAVYGLIAPH